MRRCVENTLKIIEQVLRDWEVGDLAISKNFN